jgi:hypothetical protein
LLFDTRFANELSLLSTGDRRIQDEVCEHALGVFGHLHRTDEFGDEHIGLATVQRIIQNRGANLGDVTLIV